RPEGLLLEARVYQARGDAASAARAYRAAYEIEPSWEALGGAVAALRAAGDPGWESMLAERLEAAPNDLASRLLLADSLQAAAREADALTQYEKIIGQDRSNVVALNNAAWLVRESNAAKALEYANRAAEMAPEN